MKRQLRKILRILSIIFNVKRRTMTYWFYLELDSVENGVSIDGSIPMQAKLLINDVDMCIDNNVPELFPDFVFETDNPEPECYVNGYPVTPQPLVNGYRPQHRPTPRPR